MGPSGSVRLSFLINEKGIILALPSTKTHQEDRLGSWSLSINQNCPADLRPTSTESKGGVPGSPLGPSRRALDFRSRGVKFGDRTLLGMDYLVYLLLAQSEPSVRISSLGNSDLCPAATEHQDSWSLLVAGWT